MNKDSTVTEPPVTTKDSTKVKKRKPQGRLNRQIIFDLYTKGNTTKKEIAEKAGSLATTDEGKINSVNGVIKSSEFQLQLEVWKTEQKERALERVNDAAKHLDYQLMAEDQGKLGSFIIANERLLHEGLKMSSEDEREKQVKKGSVNTMSTEDLETLLAKKRENIKEYQNIIDGEVVK